MNGRDVPHLLTGLQDALNVAHDNRSPPQRKERSPLQKSAGEVGGLNAAMISPAGFDLSGSARKRLHPIPHTCERGGVYGEWWFWPRRHRQLVSCPVRIRGRLS